MTNATAAVTPQLPFFAYGTLLPGQPNYGLWSSYIVDRRPATLEGCCLYDLGFYPMLVDCRVGSVNGLVISIAPAQYRPVLERLDYLEGYDPARPEESPYRRQKRIARLSNGRPAAVWVYVGRNELVNGLKPINSDWKHHTRTKTALLNDWWSGVLAVGDRPV